MRVGVDGDALRYRLAGIGWYEWQVLRRLATVGEGDEFYIYTVAPLVVDFKDVNIHIEAFARHPLIPLSLWSQIAIRKLAEADDLDCFWGPAHMLPATLPHGVRKVLTVHDLVCLLHPEYMDNRNMRMYALHFRRSVKRANTIIAVSERTKVDLVAELGVPESRVVVIHEGVEDSFTRLPPGIVRQRLEKLGVKSGYLLAVGTLEPRKNYPLLFRALARLPEDVKLVVAGGLGWKYSGILAELARSGLERRVRLLGYVPNEDLVTLYNGALLMVLPSVYEGFGLPILEAMACGTPVLASDTSSLPEIGGPVAAYFKSGSLDALVSALADLIGDEGRRRGMSRDGVVRARSFTWDRAAHRTLAVLKGDVECEG